MKFLTFVDLHQDRKGLKELVERARKPDIDFVICAGDISTFGAGLGMVLQQFNQLGKKFYVIPGNHEEQAGILDEHMVLFPWCINLHGQAMKIGNYLFLGYGGGGFTMEDAHFRKLARQWYSNYQDEKIVLVTHGPPFDTNIDVLPQGHVGNKDYRNFIERMKPKLVICGHLHETAGAVDEIGSTKIVNPGWEGMVIELK